MRFADDGDIIFETTGRKKYTFEKFFTPDNYGDVVCYDSDGGFSYLTYEEKREMAEYMIIQWQLWALRSTEVADE